MTDNEMEVSSIQSETPPSIESVASSKPRPSFKRTKPEAKTSTKETKVAAAVRETVSVVSLPAEVSVAKPAAAPVVGSSELAEINALIGIKSYIHNVVAGGFTNDKAKLKELQKMDVLMDEKIIDLLLGDNFKTFIHFEKGAEAIRAAAINNNIKSSLYR